MLPFSVPPEPMFDIRLPDGCAVCFAAKAFHETAKHTEPEKGIELMSLCFLRGFAAAMSGVRELCLGHAQMLGQMEQPMKGWPEFGVFWEHLKAIRGTGGTVRCRIVQEQDVKFERDDCRQGEEGRGADGK